jgi:Fe-Mn family superoxide dismutase
MNPITRRDALTGIALSGAALVTGCATTAQPRTENPHSNPATSAQQPPTEIGETTMTTPAAFASKHQPVPLPFKPTALNGISEKMITSHHENNYTGAVKNLNRVEQELAATTKDTPPFVISALRDRELTFRNSKSLHEAYFANLGGDGRRSGSIESALMQAYGSSALWEQHFRATGSGLGGGSGWVVLALELDTGELRTVGSGNHTQVLASSAPLLVMDMYEHSYQMDFGAAVPRYLDAFFANIQWDEVNRRFERAQRAVALLRANAGS